MDKFRVCILGCGSASPTLRHQPSSQIVNFRDNLFMIDCGEGSQLQLIKSGQKMSRIGHIFISHLHGDHVLGLPGLLSTLDLQVKTGKIIIHTFPEGIKILKRITDFFCKHSTYEIIYEPVAKSGGIVFENKSLTVKAFPLDHSVDAVGYLFEEKPKQRHLKGDMVKFYNIPVSKLNDIKNGDDYVTSEGVIVPNERLTAPADKQRSYAYCSDTRYMPELGKALKGVTTIYHESTYDETFAEKAKTRGHSTAIQAAMTARDAGAEQLILGHFSKTYKDENIMKVQAEKIFKGKIILANEGMKIDI